MHNSLRSLMVLTVAFLFLGLGLVRAQSHVQVELAFGKPVILAEHSDPVNYLKIGLRGAPMQQIKARTPVNLAIVLDRSGSMQGSKLEHAKQAAIMAIDRLDRNDILSVVAYDSNVQVLVPATRVSDRHELVRAIQRLEAGSNTALFAGVSKGAQEVRKFFEPGRVNRIILLSDGLANEGPSSPEELGELGASLGREGITVTTFGLGLGYNEDLMSQLARRSDGNHAFIERPEELAKVFDLEFGDVLSVMAQEVRLTVDCQYLVPVRALGRDVTIRGSQIIADLNQLYANQEKFILVEVRVPRDLGPQQKPEAKVELQYRNMAGGKRETIQSKMNLEFTTDPKEAAARENSSVMVEVVNMLGNENYKLATRLRDEGKVEDARRALTSNVSFLIEKAKLYKSDKLEKFAVQNDKDSKNLSEGDWNKTRKNMRKDQHSIDMQQSW